VTQRGGELVANAPTKAEFPSAVIRLAQACSRVSDLSFTRRLTQPAVFVEEVESVLVDLEVKYEPNVTLPGRFGDVDVDFVVETPEATSAVLTWSSFNSGYSHTKGLEIFRRFFDLQEAKLNKLTIFDDSRDVYKSQDLARLSTVSTIIPLSDRTGIRRALAA
jgi:hypothetical protein